MSIVDALNEQLLTLAVQSTVLRARVLVNDDQEPDRIAVVVE
jgi:hypothetical protein